MTKTFTVGSRATVKAVSEVSLSVDPGETLALIGESGSGKSTVGRLALALHQPDAGRVVFGDRDLASLSRTELRRTRAGMSVVFQEPYESLNPRMTVRSIVEEPLVIHDPSLDAAARRAQVVEAVEHAALGERFLSKYPHELSGGQQQRVGIARAIITRPSFIVLDEPTSSLDLSVRAQILDLLARLQEELSLAYLFISHDIHTVEYVADRIAVMYLGRIVETGKAAEIFRQPQHPYTQALLSSSLSPDPDVSKPRYVLHGEIPSPTDPPQGCVLHGRCPIGTVECTQTDVRLHPFSSDQDVACIKVPSAEPAHDRG